MKYSTDKKFWLLVAISICLSMAAAEVRRRGGSKGDSSVRSTRSSRSSRKGGPSEADQVQVRQRKSYSFYQ